MQCSETVIVMFVFLKWKTAGCLLFQSAKVKTFLRFSGEG